MYKSTVRIVQVFVLSMRINNYLKESINEEENPRQKIGIFAHAHTSCGINSLTIIIICNITRIHGICIYVPTLLRKSRWNAIA